MEMPAVQGEPYEWGTFAGLSRQMVRKASKESQGKRLRGETIPKLRYGTRSTQLWPRPQGQILVKL
jgi:hypothetical protein